MYGGGKQNSSVLFLIATSIILSVMWDPWQLKIRRIFCPVLFLAIACGTKLFLNHCTQRASLVHPFSEVARLLTTSK